MPVPDSKKVTLSAVFDTSMAAEGNNHIIPFYLFAQTEERAVLANFDLIDLSILILPTLQSRFHPILSRENHDETPGDPFWGYYARFALSPVPNTWKAGTYAFLLSLERGDTTDTAYFGRTLCQVTIGPSPNRPPIFDAQ